MDEMRRDCVTRERGSIDEQYPASLTARSMAVGAPAQRAPTTMASYSDISSSSIGWDDDDISRPTRYRGDPLCVPWFRAGRVGGGFGPAAQAELRQDAAHVVLDGLAADEEGVRDLGLDRP
jgi:hypothetical protein